MLITCAGCNTKMRVPDDAAGKRVKCPQCATIVSVPDAEPPIEIAPVEPKDADSNAETSASSGRAKPPPIKAKGRSPFDFDDDDDDEPPKKKRRRDDEVDDDDHRSSLDVRQPSDSIGYSVTSMILGVSGLLLVLVFGFGASCVGLCCCPLAPVAGALTGGVASAVVAVLALIFGYLGMQQGGKSFAIAGLIMGGVTLLLAIALVALTLIFGAALFGVLAVAQPPQPAPPFPNRF